MIDDKIHILPNGRKCYLPCEACKGYGTLYNHIYKQTACCPVCRARGYWEADDRNIKLNKKI